MTAIRGTGIPLCDLQTQYQEIQPQIEEAVARVLRSGQVILGPEVKALEEEIARYCGIGHAIGCASGTDAISLALLRPRHRARRRNHRASLLVLRHCGLCLPSRCAPGFRRHRPGNLQRRSASDREQDHATNAGHSRRPSLRPVRRYGADLECGGQARIANY